MLEVMTAGSLDCETCSTRVTPPTHCGKPMNLELIFAEQYWVCWKGEHEPCCGREASEKYTACCENPRLKEAALTMLM